MTYTIAGIPFPDAATAAAYYNSSYDQDTYPGFGEAIALLKYKHPDLSDDDITRLAEAVHQHAHRPAQGIPDRDTIRRLVKGQGIPVDPPTPDWENPDAMLTTLPPALERRHTPPAGLITRLARRIAGSR